jgi:hypothetical protein
VPTNPDPSRVPAQVFDRLAQIVYTGGGYQEIYDSLCQAAVQVVPGCDHASIMLCRNGRFVTAAASDEVAAEVDRMERELEDGPCVDAITEEAGQVDADLTTGSHWPRLAERIVASTPVRGMVGFRLVTDGSKVGALNLFSDTPGALDGPPADQGAVLAAFASVTLMASTSREQATTLRQGLESNREIGKAVGLLMAFHKVSDDQAFEILRKTSQEMNMRVQAVAKEILDHHNKR